MTEIIAPYGGYRKMLSFGFVCLAYHATETFCRRNLGLANDPLGKTAGQMVGAARSARQNMVEASSRAGTSSETELRLLDVAKASLQELAGDYEAFLLDRGLAPWSESSPEAEAFRAVRFAPFDAENGDVRHAFGKHFLKQRAKFAPFLEPEDPVAAANGILLCIDRASVLLHRQMEKTADAFAECGGFTERMSRKRLETRDAGKDAEPESDGGSIPSCPKCGGPMRRVLARKGRNAGKPFWSCRDFPACTGSRSAAE